MILNELLKYEYTDQCLKIVSDNQFNGVGPKILAEYTPSKLDTPKYLCYFASNLNEDPDNNCFFVWDKKIDNEFNSLTLNKVYEYKKQTSLKYGFEMLLL